MADSTAIKRSQSGGSSQYEEHSSNDEGATTGQNPLLGVKRRKKRGEGSYAAGFGRKTDSASWARVRSSPMAFVGNVEWRSIIQAISAPAPAPAPAPASTPQAPLIGSSSSQNRALAPIAHNTSTQPPALRFLPRPPVPRPQAQAQSMSMSQALKSLQHTATATHLRLSTSSVSILSTLLEPDRASAYLRLTLDRQERSDIKWEDVWACYQYTFSSHIATQDGIEREKLLKKEAMKEIIKQAFDGTSVDDQGLLRGMKFRG